MRFLLVLLTSVALAQTAPIKILAVTNAADFQPGLPTNGSLASIFCTGLEGGPGIVYASESPISNRLAGVSVTTDSLQLETIGLRINPVPAPILAIAFLDGYQQINIQVSWQAGTPVGVVVAQGGQYAHREVVRGSEADVFFSGAGGFGIIRHASNFSPVTAESPAQSGEELIAYGINLGPVYNTPPDGVAAPFDPPYSSPQHPNACSLSQQIRIGSGASISTYVGLAPGTVGVYQFNFTLSAAGAAGNLPMTLVSTARIDPFGACFSNGSGQSEVITTSRSVLIPVR